MLLSEIVLVWDSGTGIFLKAPKVILMGNYGWDLLL